ncbi:metallophosphoesterase family protein [Bacillus sp. DJP31]|uniref:metallophosphoesterase family protein n=1 Tax=Bacillus sp. DJP31 TaxID=3409789 RepID=UPI003BB6E8D7
MEQITFLHAADLHLDSPYIGLKRLPDSLFKRVQESTFVSLQRLVTYAIKNQVDFIIIAGDLYDAEQRSLKAQIRVRNEMLRLERVGIQVYVIHGNHDPLNGNWIKLDWPSNVHIFSGEIEVKTFIKEGKHLANLYGFSYSQKAITENMAAKYEKKCDNCFHIGLLHGTISSNNEHVPYAPFQLSDLKNKDFDYWALGHIHQKQIVNEDPPIVYPGNIQGRHKKETGEKGCYLVSISETASKNTFIDTCDIIWENIQVPITDIHTIDELIKRCKQVLDRLRRTDQGVFVNVSFTGHGELSALLQEFAVIEDMLEILIAGEEEQQNFVWICSYENQTQSVKDLEQLKKDMHFVGDLLQHFEQYDHLQEALSPLYDHKQGRRFIAPLLQEEQEALLHEAEAWIVNELLNFIK